MILLDTHVLIWSQSKSRKLSRNAESAIRRAEHSSGVAVSAITLVEVASLLDRGRLALHGSLDATLKQLTRNISVLPITLDIAVLTASFPADFPSDPMDRIIAATARAEGLPLVTADRQMLDCPLLKTIW